MNRWIGAAVPAVLGACSSKYVMSPVPIDHAKIADDKTTVTLGFLGEPCDRDSEVNIAETGAALKVTLRVRSRKGPCSAVGIRDKVVVKLRSPIGNKTLLDSTGKPISLAPPPPDLIGLPFPVRKVTFTT